MKQLPYGDSSIPMHFEFPTEWDGTLVSAVSLTIKDRDATELLAADNITLYTATTLDSAPTDYSDEITLASGAGNLTAGDFILIDGVEGAEKHRVKGYDTTNKIVYLEDILENSHEAGDDVYGLFGNYTLDLSTTATFTSGLILTLIWTPTGSGQPKTEVAQVATYAVNLQGIEKEFAAVYPRAYEAFVKPDYKFPRMLNLAKKKVERDLLASELDFNRIVNQEDIEYVVMAQLAYMWTLNGDENMKDEREHCGRMYASELEILKQLPIWTDRDQDLVEDDSEVMSHRHFFKRAW